MSTRRAEELEKFRRIRFLRNHWDRPADPKTYYWYLTFEDHPEVQRFAARCQQEIRFPYYDLTPPEELHLTIDRIAFDGSITLDQLGAIEDAAMSACAKIPPTDIMIGSLGGTQGAIGFSAYPVGVIRELRDAFRSATVSVCPDAPVGNEEFHPHVTIAYSNSDGISAAEAIAAVERVDESAYVTVSITCGTLVLLERRPRSYRWQVVSEIPLSG